MRVHIQKWGNSSGVRIPKAILDQVGVHVGGTLEATVHENTIVLRASKRRYKLADLLAQCDQDTPAPDLGAWDDINPVGQEVW